MGVLQTSTRMKIYKVDSIKQEDKIIYRAIVLASDKRYYYHDFDEKPTESDIQSYWENSENHLSWREYDTKGLNMTRI